MKGRHHIVVETRRLKYEFDIKRNITIESLVNSKMS